MDKMHRTFKVLDKNIQTIFESFVKDQKTYQYIKGTRVTPGFFLKALHIGNIVVKTKVGKLLTSQVSFLDNHWKDYQLNDWKQYFRWINKKK